jgi:hypothetical protein
MPLYRLAYSLAGIRRLPCLLCLRLLGLSWLFLCTVATAIPVACIDVDLGQEVLLSVPCRSEPVGPLRHGCCLYHAMYRLRPAQRHTPSVTHVSTAMWP